MNEILHTSSIRVIGGRAGRTISPDGQLDVPLRRPAASRSDERGTNPEQLFAAGYAACFAGAMANAARRAGATLGEVVIDNEVQLVKIDEDVYTLIVTLDVVSAGNLDDDLLRVIVLDADTICPYSCAVRGNIAVDLRARGKSVRG